MAIVGGLAHRAAGVSPVGEAGAPPPSGTTNASTRRTSRVARRPSTVDSSGESGRLSSSPPSATQWLRVMLAKRVMSGRSGIPGIPATWVPIGM